MSSTKFSWRKCKAGNIAFILKAHLKEEDDGNPSVLHDAEFT